LSNCISWSLSPVHKVMILVGVRGFFSQTVSPGPYIDRLVGESGGGRDYFPLTNKMVSILVGEGEKRVHGGRIHA
jgi:hypothetical protein